MPRLDERSDRVPELDPAARVEPGRGLVEEQQSWLSDQAGAEVEPPAHASRIGAHEPFGGLDEIELLEHPLGARARRSPVLTVEAGDQLEVLASAHRGLDGGELAGEAEQPPHAIGLAAHVMSKDAQRARVGPQQRRDGADEGGLAGPVRAEHGRHLA